MGVDLASQPAKTAVCLIRWGDDPPRVMALYRGKAGDGTVLHTKWLSTTAYGIRGDWGGPITKVGIDAPFGWPESFMDAIAAYREAPAWPVGLDNEIAALRLRRTDEAVHARAGKWPLSVSSDKIAGPAMRCAMLLTDIAQHRGREAVQRDGSGLCCEVYPDPALRHWTAGAAGSLAARESYKGKDAADKRVALLGIIRDRLPLEDADGLLEAVALEDDHLDALICALVARAAELGGTIPPRTADERQRAAVEGWIHLPAANLPGLVGERTGNR